MHIQVRWVTSSLQCSMMLQETDYASVPLVRNRVALYG